MTLTERCQAGEAKLDAVSRALADPRPEILDDCEGELREVIELLESAESCVPANRAELTRLRKKVRLLGMQTQNALNLCQGWTQLGLTHGYTDQGTPVLPLSEPQTSYEA